MSWFYLYDIIKSGSIAYRLSSINHAYWLVGFCYIKKECDRFRLKGENMKDDNKCINETCKNFITSDKCKMFKLISWCGFRHYKTSK